jgi:hypothetical protein
VSNPTRPSVARRSAPGGDGAAGGLSPAGRGCSVSRAIIVSTALAILVIEAVILGFSALGQRQTLLDH